MNYGNIKNTKIRALLEEFNPPEGLLDIDHHEEILSNINKYSKICGVAIPYIFKSALDIKDINIDDTDIRYIIEHKDLVKKGTVGFIYQGSWSPSITERMQVLGAILIRNKILPRVVTVNTLFRELETNINYNPKYIMIPSFVSNRTISMMAQHDLYPEDIYDWLNNRMLQGRITILGIPSPGLVREVFDDVYDDLKLLLAKPNYLTYRQGGSQ